MRTDNIGITPGVFKDEGYDTLKTLELAAGNLVPDVRAGIVQCYLSEELLRDWELQVGIAKKANDYGIRLMVHVENPPFSSGTFEIIRACERILRYESQSRVVIHYHDGLDYELARMFNLSGMKVCVENFHGSLANAAELGKCERHFLFLAKACSSGMNAGAVFDIGRYLYAIPEFMAPYIRERICAACILCKNIGIPFFFHVSGASSFSARDYRMLAPGDPMDVIRGGDFIRAVSRRCDLKNPDVIIECEEASQAASGLKYFRELELKPFQGVRSE